MIEYGKKPMKLRMDSANRDLCLSAGGIKISGAIPPELHGLSVLSGAILKK